MPTEDESPNPAGPDRPVNRLPEAVRNELVESPVEAGCSRKKGRGRRSLESSDPGFERALDELLRETTRGDPEAPLLWTCKSTRSLAREMAALRCGVSHETIARILREKGYNLHGEGGRDHPGRYFQFRHLSHRVKLALLKGQPVISVVTERREPAGRHEGPVSIGTDHDPGAFAIASIRDWWRNEGRRAYPGARWLIIIADCGRSKGYRRRLWKLELQKLSDEIGFPVRVCHFPPGTSKWNKKEHRLFSFISSNWRARPLYEYETIVRLIGAVAANKGLSVSLRLDHRGYPTGKKVTDEEMRSLHLFKMRFHGEWNYVLRPATRPH